MRKLIEFIRSTYVVVLFVALELTAVGYYARSNSYTQARLLARSNQFIGGVHGLFTGVRRYLGLEGKNRVLLARIAELEEQLALYREAANFEHLNAYVEQIGASKYRFLTATVVANSINRRQNLITLNRGLRDGISPEMAILSPDGAMVGYVMDCSERYSVAISILNTSFRASGKLAGSDYSGALRWDGLDQHYVLLEELSKYAEPKPGDEIITTGFSQYFPADVLIGWVESAELNEMRTSYTVRVRLAAELSRLTEVILVGNNDLQEIGDLQQSEQIEQLHR